MVAGLALAVGCCLPSTVQAYDVVIEQATAPRTPVFVAMGASAQLPVIVRNDGATVAALVTLRALTPSFPQPPQWQFGPAPSPRCSAVRLVDVPINGGPFTLPAWEFDVSELQPGERIACDYGLSRAANASADLLLVWQVVGPADDPGPEGNQASWVAGNLTALELTATPTCDGEPAPGRHHLRISLANLGPTAVDSTRFGRCIPPFPGFDVTGDFPGGCGASVGAPGGCFMGGIGWNLGALAPGQQRSCLLALSARASPGGLAEFPVRILEPYASGTLQILDLDPAGGETTLAIPQPSLQCGAPPVAAAPVPGVRDVWLALMAVLLLAAAWLTRFVRAR